METSPVVHRSLIKKPSAREMRATRRGIRFPTHRFASIKGIHRLAATAIDSQDRYGRKFGTVSPLERVFRRAIYSTVYSPNIALHIAPKYALAFRWLQQIGQSHHFRKHLIERVFLSRLAADRREPIQQVVSLVPRLTEQHRRIDHVVQRLESVRSNQGTPDPETERSHAAPVQYLWSRPVEMVLKREAAPVQTVRQETMQTAAPDRPRVSRQNAERLTHSRREYTLAEFSPNEVKRLTDQVVDTLDRRIIAMRERLGRV